MGRLCGSGESIRMNSFIPVNTPLLSGNEKKYLMECIDSGWISSEGPFVAEFEEKFSSRVDRSHGIAVSNGTAALDIAIEALDIGPGDEVILPSFTIISCVNQIVRVGAIPVLVDSDPITWNMDVEQVEHKITTKTKAIMIVHIYGLPVDLDPLIDVAKKYELKILEDAAEMIGQTYKGKPCGSFGDISTFSFYPNKHITTGEGGMIVTNDSHLAETCRSLRNLCFKTSKRFVHDRLGWNCRITNLQAAIGLAQLEQLDDFLILKRKMGNLYLETLSSGKNFLQPLRETSYAENIFWVFGIVIDDSFDLDADEVMKKLSSKGIGTRPFFYPLHKQPILKEMGFFEGVNLPVSERLYKKGLYLPSGLALTKDEIRTVSNAILEVFN